MKPLRCILAAAAILICLVARAEVRAAEQLHTVRAGDSVSSIAKQYYGDMDLAELMMRYNGRTGTTIRAGEKLKIPICEVHKVGAGDTWSRLTTKYLNRASVFPVVARLNGLEPDHVLQPGESIVMPVVHSHKMARGDSLASLAERFYGNTNLAGLLQTFNELEDPRRLSIGQTVQVPLITLVPRKSRPEGLNVKKPLAMAAATAASPEPPKTAATKPSQQAPKPGPVKAAATKPPAQEPRPATAKNAATKAAATKPPAQESTPGAAKAPVATAPQKSAELPAEKAPRSDPTPTLPPVTLPHATSAVKVPETPAKPEPAVVKPLGLDKEIAEASKAFSEGNYARARQLLEPMRERTRGGGTDAEKVAVGRLLAFVYVAFDMKKEACSTFRSISGLDAKPGLDSDLVSPKIREALSGCTAGST